MLSIELSVLSVLILSIAGQAKSNAHDKAQALLNSVPQQKHKLPIILGENGLNLVNITIGTPPQLFNVSLHLSANDIFVLSTNCTGTLSICNRFQTKHQYNSTESSTYALDGRRASVDWEWNEYQGRLSKDTIQLATLKIENRTFSELQTTAIDYDSLIARADGGLGLAPPWNTWQFYYPNFLREFSKKKILQENVFSLKLPRSSQEEGELMFGGSNPDLYTGEFSTIQLLPDSDITVHRSAIGFWNLPLSSITLDFASPYRLATPNYTATLTTAHDLVVPKSIINELIPMSMGQESMSSLHQIPCDQRTKLPSLTFEIRGNNITIDGFDYTAEVNAEDNYRSTLLEGDGPYCEMRISSGWNDRSVRLGAPFLKTLYTRFNMDTKTFSFAKLRD